VRQARGLDDDSAMAMGAGGSRLRRVGAHLLAVIGVAALAGGAALGMVRRSLFDSDTFASRLADSLNDPRVSAYVAEQMTSAVLREKPDLVAVRPLLVSTANGLAGSSTFQGIVRVTARQAHAAALSKGGRDLLLSVPDVGIVLRGALANANPTLAARVPQRVTTAIANLGDTRATRFVVDMWQAGRTLAWTAGVTAVAGLLLLIGGIALSRRRALALRRASLDLALAGLFLVLLIPAARALVSLVPDTPLAQQAAAGLFDAFTRGLRRLALGLAGVGLVFAAAAHSLLGRAWLPDQARSVWAWLARRPLTTGQHLLRGGLFLSVGAGLVMRPAASLTVLAVVAGAVLAFAGLQALFRLALRALPEEQAEVEGGALRRFGGGRVLAALAIAGGLAAAIAVVTRPEQAGIVQMTGCNGDTRLCPRRLDQVVFAATHNAMSAAERPGWMFAQQERDLAGQLADGVRAFLIDVHAGVPVSGRIKTEISGQPGFKREMAKAVGTAGVEATERTRERMVGPPEGPRALYLCHGFCELGAQPLVPWLRTLREFLAVNPRDVVLLVIEDYVSPVELSVAFASSGLTDLAYRGAPLPPWPTLEELASSGQRVITFLESGKAGVGWMYPAFESIQETPYRFHQPSELSCRANRGGTTGSLFQINHWIETPPMPRPSNAALVNNYDVLLRRVEECRRERHRLPNIIAVDFYRTGDLFNVVRHLNGLDAFDLPQKK
jgi:hypothetical protein